MRAGLTTRCLTFRDTFVCTPTSLISGVRRHRQASLTLAFKHGIATLDGGSTNSLKEECLSKLILFGEKSLRHALREYVIYHHRERNHQGKENLLLFSASDPLPQSERQVRSRERLGGLLRFYHREAA